MKCSSYDFEFDVKKTYVYDLICSFRLLPRLIPNGVGVEQQLDLGLTLTPLELGLESQKLFRSVGIFCHGFLAGMAFWNVVMVATKRNN